jgi:hypothetical protein
MTGDLWTLQFQAFGRLATGRKLAKRRLRELAVPDAQLLRQEDVVRSRFEHRVPVPPVIDQNG